MGQRQVRQWLLARGKQQTRIGSTFREDGATKAGGGKLTKNPSQCLGPRRWGRQRPAGATSRPRTPDRRLRQGQGLGATARRRRWKSRPPGQRGRRWRSKSGRGNLPRGRGKVEDGEPLFGAEDEESRPTGATSQEADAKGWGQGGKVEFDRVFRSFCIQVDSARTALHLLLKAQKCPIVQWDFFVIFKHPARHEMSKIRY